MRHDTSTDTDGKQSISRNTDPSRRGLESRNRDSREAHRIGGARAGIREWCRGNVWATENAKAVGNW